MYVDTDQGQHIAEVSRIREYLMLLLIRWQVGKVAGEQTSDDGKIRKDIWRASIFAWWIFVTPKMLIGENFQASLSPPIFSKIGGDVT